MEMRIRFPGGKRVAAEYNGFTMATDQPAGAGGEGSAPAPFDLFLASLGTCAGIYVLEFLRRRDLDTRGLEQRHEWDPQTGRLEKVDLELRLPAGFPEKYRQAVVQAAGLCAVKRHLDAPPEFHVHIA